MFHICSHVDLVISRIVEAPIRYSKDNELKLAPVAKYLERINYIILSRTRVNFPLIFLVFPKSFEN